MGAAGLTLFLLVVLRIILDIKGYAPIPRANTWRWGMAAIAGSALMVISVVVAVWRYLP